MDKVEQDFKHKLVKKQSLQVRIAIRLDMGNVPLNFIKKYQSPFKLEKSCQQMKLQNILFKKQKQKIYRNYTEHQKKKQTEIPFNELDEVAEYTKIFEHDSQNLKSKRYFSGWNVLKSYERFSQTNERILRQLQRQYLEIDLKELSFLHRKLKQFSSQWVFSQIYNYLHAFLIIFQILIQGIEGDSLLSFRINFIISFIFLLNSVCYIIAIGFKQFCKDETMICDFVASVFYLFDIVLMLIPFYYQYQRFFQLFSLFRLNFLLRQLSFQRFIIMIFQKTFNRFISIILLSFLFMTAMGVIGFQQFNKQYNDKDFRSISINFSTISDSFLLVFNLTTLNGFNIVLELTYRQSYSVALFISLIVVIIQFISIFQYLLLLQNMQTFYLFNMIQENKFIFEQLIQKSHQMCFRSDYKFNVYITYSIINIFSRQVRTPYFNLCFRIIYCIIVSVVGGFIILNLLITNMLDGFNQLQEQQNSQNLINNIQEVSDSDSDNGDNRDLIQQIQIDDDFGLEQLDQYLLNEAINSTIRKVHDDDEESSDSDNQSESYIKQQKRFYGNLLFYAFQFILKILLIIISILRSLDLDNQWINEINYSMITISSIILLRPIIFICQSNYDERIQLLKKNKLEILNIFLAFFYLTSYLIYGIGKGQTFLDIMILCRIIHVIEILVIDKKIQILWQSFIQSFKNLSQIFFILTIWMIIFAIIGVIMFKNRFGSCGKRFNFGISQEKCKEMNLEWIVYSRNFDDIFGSMQTLFNLVTFDDWHEILYTAIHSGLPQTGPIYDNNKWTSCYYFTLFMIIYAMFLMNLLVGYIFTFYQKYFQSKKHKTLTENQFKWIELMKYLINYRSRSNRQPTNQIQKKIFLLVFNQNFIYFMDFFALSNTVYIAFVKDFQESHYLLIFISKLFFVIFLSEGILKLSCLGFKQYYQQKNSVLEILVLLSLSVEFVALQMNLKHYQLYYFRILQSLQLYRIVSKLSFFNNIIQTFSYCMQKIIHVIYIMLCISIVYATFGVYYFGKFTYATQDFNFNNIINALQILIVIQTGDAWGNILQETLLYYQKSKINPFIAYFFFNSYIVINYCILMNFLIMILIEQFNEFYNADINPMTFQNHLSNFNNAWSQNMLDISQNSKMNIDCITENKILMILKMLKPPLGIKNNNFFQTGKKFLNLDLFCTTDGIISFNQLFYSIIKTHYKKQVFKNITDEGIVVLSMYEKQFFNQIYGRRQNNSRRKNQLIFSTSYSETGQTKEFRRASPLNTYLIVQMALKAWIQFAKQNSNKQQNLDPSQSTQIQIDSQSFITQQQEEDQRISNNLFSESLLSDSIVNDFKQNKKNKFPLRKAVTFQDTTSADNSLMHLTTTQIPNMAYDNFSLINNMQ